MRQVTALARQVAGSSCVICPLLNLGDPRLMIGPEQVAKGLDLRIECHGFILPAPRLSRERAQVAGQSKSKML